MIVLEMPQVRKILMKYVQKNVWNAEELGSFNRQPLNWKISKPSVQGFKEEKKHGTFLAYFKEDTLKRCS